MTFTAILTLLPMLFGLTAVEIQDGQPQVRRIVVENRLIIRVPVRPPPARIEWVERKGPKCVASAAIRGAFLSGGDHVDLLMARGRLLRADLSNDCPALDFYEGFYLNPEDEMICADRDVIRSRMGGSCRIERFRQLVPRPRR
ncbi:MAG: hypothetical protein H0W39_10705 [Sphingomonas sp.]|nr:hypothetical protein [Sphingomonas sp.]